MEQTPFYVVGGILVVLAVIVSFIGLRNEKFPPSRRVMIAGIALFAIFVAATAAAAVINARDEQEHRRAELAELAEEEGAESAEAAETGTEGPTAASEGEQEEAAAKQDDGAAAGGETLELTSPESGDLLFEPTELAAASGTVTIEYTNPSSVTHNVAIEDSSGETLSEGELVAQGGVSTASADVEPGEYVFYCAVAGHREGGMEGPLSVE